jgi:hypothetical protein
LKYFVSLLLLLSACFFLVPKVEAVASAEVAEAVAATPTLDFIYVNANTGEAAGGHTAIRLGSTVFHFQFFPDGRFLLVRESWPHFRYIYNELRNRTISISRVPLTAEAYSRLRNHFTHLLLTQQQNLNHLQAAENEQVLLTQLNNGASKLALEAVGLFDDASAEDDGMRNLNQIISEALGENFVMHQRKQIETKLAKHALEADQPVAGLTWTARLQALLLEREFYRIIEQGMSLASDRILSTSLGAAELTPEQRKMLQKFSEQLATSVVGLMQSQRPDRAKSLLLQTARYLAVKQSLATNTLLTLDPFSSRANVVQMTAHDELQGLHAQLQQNAMRAQQDFFQATTNLNIAYALLEASLGRLYELENALHTGSSVRVESGMLLPAHKGFVSLDFPYAHMGLSTLIAENQAKQLQLQQQVDEQYAYNLFARNCATELLRSLNAAFAHKIVGAKELGGWLQPNQSLVFIPNQFYTQIAERFPVQDKEVLPARRLRQLNELYAERTRGNVLSLWLRESNTLSTTLYKHRIEDTHFLFFTDDALLFRPVFGVSNFLWGAINSVGGVFSLPIDAGERFHQGLRGMFYSLPELLFGNIRKGTYGFAETATIGP